MPTSLEVGARRRYVGEQSFKLPQVFPRRRVKDYRPIASGTLHFFHAEPVPLQSPLGLGWTKVHVQSVAFVFLHRATAFV